MKKKILIGLLVGLSMQSNAQQQHTTSVAIFHKLQKLAFLGKVMYVAAHPDDENTNVISYFANNVHATTAYLSLTRGDGGQNLVGPQLREALGVIRTQELLAARRIDGGQQFFTRANDFGYSKNPKETFTFWEKDKLMHDVVWAFRKFKPDVIINRFDHRTPGSTHGHHTTSAMISVEAFDKAADKTAYTDQLQHVDAHKVQAVYLNKSSWFFKNDKDFQNSIADDITIDIGNYYPSLGYSNTEIAALSRSQHKSQGFGTLSSRGKRDEYFELIKGDKSKSNFFENIDTTWERVEGGAAVAGMLNRLIEDFDFENPSENVSDLIDIHKEILSLKDSHWKKEKLPLLENIIIDCLGIYLNASTEVSQITPSDSLSISIEAVNRSAISVDLKNVLFESKPLIENKKLANNNVVNETTSVTYSDKSFTTPYYLTKESSVGMYTVDDKLKIGLPETPSSFLVTFNLNVNDYPISTQRAIKYKYRDRVAGEVYEPFFVIPEIDVRPEKELVIFPSPNEKKINVSLLASKSDQKGKLSIDVPENWIIQPESIDFSITKGNEKTFSFNVIPPLDTNGNALAKITATTSNGNSYSNYAENLEFDHIPKQQIIHKSEIQLVNFSIKTGTKKIAYIQGAGDSVDKNLNLLGLNVKTIDVDNLNHTNLNNFDVILLGIRALNKFPELITNKGKFHAFAKNGGTVIVQYNTKPYRGGTSVGSFFPYDLTLSRDRVTDETAEVTFLKPNHSVLNTPNKITSKDFDNWVQERGLYYPNKWGKEFTPILGMHDADELETKGSLLISDFGKGHFVYTGISFFRELPKGVTGAYRLLVNIINL